MNSLVPVGKFYHIDTFDGRMFSIMSDGTTEGTEIFKYKGEVPGHFTMWACLPNMLECVSIPKCAITLESEDIAMQKAKLKLRQEGFHEAADYIEENL